MPLPVIAIVGRPNVGKSSLFNSIARRRTSIVEPTPGVTRDRVSTICSVNDVYYELVDTGGHGIVDVDDLTEHIERQIQYAIDQAHLILFVVDAREGLNPLDRRTADLLRTHTARVRVVANKVDEPHLGNEAGDFVKLGFGEPLTASAVTGHGRTALLEIIEACAVSIGGPDAVEPADPVMKIAVVGKRNAGKSTFINSIAGEERVIVSEVPGTTRDSIDVRFEKDGRTLLAIDTAGIRKKAKIANDVEYYAFTRATHSIRRADVVLLLIDATVPVGQVDKKLARYVRDEFKPCILVVNKWDKAKGRADSEDYGEYLTKMLPEIDYAPVAFTSATTGRNIFSTIDLASELFKQSRTRVGTGRLNQILKDATALNAPRPKRGRKPPRMLYATQVSTQPPTIAVFVNGTNLITPGYERFLLNRLRERLPFDEVPIRLLFRSRRERAPRT
ncbi:MAG: ribosome biogenesis GTPase Der [Planctomycetes bacterium]|nr:ribosome biogenesis GTPase Der [Planctomycetota bacterium]